MRVTALLGNASVIGQSGLEHASPFASGGLFSNGGADMNGLASRFQSEVRILTINITIYLLIYYFAEVLLTQYITFHANMTFVLVLVVQNASSSVDR